ncbi:MAG: hypothetical protein LN417_04285 [Candidatus Thermoplasmatota archaeon]|nr:hypothetical protein [Candidatus Thermoplasmatota archaeon]
MYKQIRGRGTRLCAGKLSFLLLDFVGNSVRFNKGYVPPKEEPLDPEMGGSHRGRSGKGDVVVGGLAGGGMRPNCCQGR